MSPPSLGAPPDSHISSSRSDAGRCRLAAGAMDGHTAVALAIILAWCTLLGTMAVLRHLAFNSIAYDLGIFDQVIWNTAHGNWFQNSIMRDSPSHLGHHFSPVLLVLVPLYWIRPDPLLLVAVQALLVGFAGLPLFWLARDLLGSPRPGLFFLAAFLLHPAAAYICLFDFHEVAFAVPLLSLALLLMLRRDYRPMLLALVPLLLVKEDMGLVCAAVGAYVALGQRRWRLGVSLAAAGVAWTALLIGIVIPAFHPSAEYYFTYLYASAGSNPAEIARTVLARPEWVWGQVTRPDKLEYLQKLLVPLGGLPLLGLPLLVVALPGLLAQLLSDNMPVALIKFQYSATVLPPLMAAAAFGCRWAAGLVPRFRAAVIGGLCGLLLAASLLGAYLYGPLPLAIHFQPDQYAQQPRFDTLRQMLGAIPPEASVVAQCNIVPHLSRRAAIYQFYLLGTNPPPDYYLLDTLWRGCAFWFAENDRVLGQVLADPGYREVEDRDYYVLLHQEPSVMGREIGAVVDGQLEVAGVTLPETAVTAGESLTVDIYYRALRPLEEDYSLFLTLVDGDGVRWGQWHGYPVGGRWPSSDWPPDQLLRGHRRVPVLDDAPPGGYRLQAELLRLPSMEPVPFTEPAQDAGRTSVLLGSVKVAASP